jgi:hypothetical protein
MESAHQGKETHFASGNHRSSFANLPLSVVRIKATAYLVNIPVTPRRDKPIELLPFVLAHDPWRRRSCHVQHKVRETVQVMVWE